MFIREFPAVSEELKITNHAGGKVVMSVKMAFERHRNK
jgi:hypothetical protein